MIERRAFLTTTGLAITALAGCVGGSDGSTDDPTPAATTAPTTTAPATTEPARETATAAADRPLLDAEDPDFQAAADAALADAASEPGTGAMYLEIVNHAGTTYYGTDTHTNLNDASITPQGMLVFKTPGTMPHTFGVHDPFATGSRRVRRRRRRREHERLRRLRLPSEGRAEHAEAVR